MSMPNTVDRECFPEGPAACAGLVELGRHPALGAELGAVLAGSESTAEALQRLSDQGQDRAALRALAHLLPIRRAVWWAVLCAWHGTGDQPSADQDVALAASVRWVCDPSEASRRTAEQVARLALADNAAGCCACAASLAGSLAPARDRFVVRELFPAAALVAQAIAFAVAERQAAGLPVSRRQLLEVGIDLWDGNVP